MNHAITVHDLLKFSGYVVGGLLMVGGFFGAFFCAWANSAQIIPEEDSGAISALIIGIVGLAMIVGAYFLP